MISWLARDWGLKLIALILAVGLWHYAIGEEGIEIQRTLPLTVEIENPHMSILKTSVDSVQVTLSVPRGLVSSIASEEFVARHIISADVTTAGEYSFRLEGRDIQLPSPYIRIMKIEPEVIQVTLDELIIKKLEVKANFSGDPAFGYKVSQEELQLNPNAVLLEGPKAQLDALSVVETQPVDLVGRIRSFRRTVSVNLPFNVKPVSESLIDVFIPIKEEFGEKQFENIPVHILETSGQDRFVTVEPDTVSFVVKGARRRLNELKNTDVLAYVDIEDLKFGDHEPAVSLRLPEEMSLKENTDLKVKVSIQKTKP